MIYYHGVFHTMCRCSLVCTTQFSFLLPATLARCLQTPQLAIRLGAEVERFLPLRRLDWLVLTSDEEYGAWVCCDGTKLYRNTQNMRR